MPEDRLRASPGAFSRGTAQSGAVSRAACPKRGRARAGTGWRPGVSRAVREGRAPLRGAAPRWE